MAGRIKGITIEIDGNTVGLEKALQTVNGQARSLQGQLSDVNRLLKFNPGNAQLLAQKQRLLAQQVENTKNKLNQLKDAQAQVDQQFAKGKLSEKQYQAFQREIIETESKLGHFKSQLSIVETQLNKTGLAASRLGRDFKKSFDEAKAAQGNTFDGLKTAGAAVTGFGAAMAAGLGLGVKAAADQQRQMAALETAFQGNTKAAQEYYKWAQQYGKTTPFETADVIDATIKLKSYGLEAKNTLGPIGDMAASMGKPLDQAIEAVADAQTGELERLKEFGITKQMLIDQAAKMGKDEVVNAKGQIVDQQAMNDALLALMEQRFKGSMDRQSKTLLGQLSALRDSITMILQSLGNALLPILTPIVTFIQKLADQFNQLPASMQTTIAVVMAIVAALALLTGPLLLLIGFLPQIAAGFTMLMGPVGAVIGIVALVVAAIVGLVDVIHNLWTTNEQFRNNVLTVWQGIQAIFQAVMPAITAIIKVAWLLIKSIIVSTLDAIKNVIQGAFGVIANIFKLFGSIFTGNWKGAWDAIKGLLQSAVQLIWGIVNLYFLGKLLAPLKAFGPAAKGILQAIWNFIKGIFTGGVKAISGFVEGGFNFIRSVISGVMRAVWSIIKSIWNSIRGTTSGVVNGIKNVVSRAWNGIKNSVSNAMSGVWNAIKNGWNRALNFLKGINLWNIGKNIIHGLVNGIGSMMGALQAKIKAIASSIKSKFESVLDINSPSRVMRDEVGKMIGAGLELGMIDSLRGIGQAAQKMSQAAIPAVPGINAPDTSGFSAQKNMVSAKKSVNNDTVSAQDLTDLVKAINGLVGRPIVLNINGKAFAQATAGDTDAEGGNRIRRLSRGLAT